MNFESLEFDLCYRMFRTSKDVGFVGCGFVRKPVGVDWDDTAYNHYALVYVLQGVGRFVDEDGRVTELRAGSVFQRLPNKRHSVYIDEGEEWVEAFLALKHTPVVDEGLVDSILNRERVQAEWIAELQGVSGSTTEILSRLNVINLARRVWFYGLEQVLVRQFQSLFAELKGCAERGVSSIQPKLLALLIRLNEVSEVTDKPLPVWLAEAVQRLRKDSADRTPLPQLLEGLGRSYPHLRAEFKKRLGISPGNYRIKLRIEEACVLLSHHRLTVQETAYRLRYPDPFTFSAQFKQVMEISPSHFMCG